MPSTASKQQHTADLRHTRDYRNYVDGQWVVSSSGRAFENRNPADNDDLIGTFQESNEDDVNAAIDAAHKAYDGWREVGLNINVPLSGPHWLCVESLQWIEGLLARLPGLRALDTEDTRQDHGEGPGLWNRPPGSASGGV